MKFELSGITFIAGFFVYLEAVGPSITGEVAWMLLSTLFN